MRAVIVYGTLFVFLFASFPAASQDVRRKREWCGTERTRAALPLETLSQMEKAGQRPDTPAAEILLFVDFDGATVRPGFANSTGQFSTIVNSIRTCPAPALNADQKNEVIRLLKDDYSPFNVRITTNQSDFDSYSPAANKELVIVTTLPSVIGQPTGISGVAPFTNIGTRLPFDPSFVFSAAVGNDPVAVAATVSHETGHTMGLAHQHLYNGSCGVTSEYHPGFGTGPIAFAPIMGEGINATTGGGIINWWAQSCPDPTFGVPQNDYALLNQQVDVVSDDFPNSALGVPVLARTFLGRLEQAGDTDYISINFKARQGSRVTSDNIDLKVSLCNAAGTVIAVFDDPAGRNVNIPYTPRARFLKIEAGPNPNISSAFMTGHYRVQY